VSYLWAVHDEAARRGYAFDESRIGGERHPIRLAVSRGQLAYEWEHLKAKLRQRDSAHFRAVSGRRKVVPHPIFKVVAGGIEDWERVR
jgi:hypothetical protein